MTNKSKKSGIVTIIGEVNVGKSSLLNILVKKNISIITHKSNTTTKQIKGIKRYKNFTPWTNESGNRNRRICFQF